MMDMGLGVAALAAVSIGYGDYTPKTLPVVAGETVRWTQDSVRKHTVTARDASFDSGSLSTGETYERTFAAVGDYPYYCRLHAGISGEIDVRTVVLDEQRDAATKGRPFPLTGRAAADVRQVTVEGDDGSATTATVTDDGTFTANVTPGETTTYRAADSTPVTLRVLDRAVTTHVRARPGRRWSVTAVVAPASAGAKVVLQLRLRDRFGWWPVATGRLGVDSATTLRTARASRAPARVVLTLDDGATPLAVSRTFHLGLRAPTAHAGTS
jgi:hypothetical protein